MTAAAFSATFCDWKLIKGRKVVAIIFEIPLEGADVAYQALGGMPDPGKSVWCAIARLNSEPKESEVMPAERQTHSRPPEMTPVSVDKPARARKPVAAEKRLAQQAGICCADPVFWRFLFEQRYLADLAQSEENVADYIRIYCAVQSRSEIIPGSKAGRDWERLHNRFLAWRDHDIAPSERELERTEGGG